MAIFTSRFSNPELKKGIYTLLRISMGTPKWNTGYRLDGELPDLMPFGLKGRAFAFFQQGYIARLDKIGIGKIKSRLQQFQNDSKDVVLLCYEDIRKPGTWCHRTMFADWWHKMTGETIEELPNTVDKALSKASGATSCGAIAPPIQLTLLG